MIRERRTTNRQPGNRRARRRRRRAGVMATPRRDPASPRSVPPCVEAASPDRTIVVAGRSARRSAPGTGRCGAPPPGSQTGLAIVRVQQPRFDLHPEVAFRIRRSRSRSAAGCRGTQRAQRVRHPPTIWPHVPTSQPPPPAKRVHRLTMLRGDLTVGGPRPTARRPTATTCPRGAGLHGPQDEPRARP